MCKQSYRNIISKLLPMTSFLVLAVFINITIVQGDSMNPSLNNHDVLLGLKTHRIEKGDIIVFEHNDEIMIKRVWGVGGDSIRSDAGKLFINDVKITNYECYSDDCDYIIADDCFFVLGDNSDNSVDSRSYGVISSESVIAKYVLKLYPYK